MPYAFTAEDFNKFSEDVIQAGGDQAVLTTLLADMTGTVTEAIAKDIAATKTVETVTAENERLKKSNMDLFLRVGSQAAGQDQSGTAQEDDKPLDTASYMKSYFEKLDSKK